MFENSLLLEKKQYLFGMKTINLGKSSKTEWIEVIIIIMSSVTDYLIMHTFIHILNLIGVQQIM